MLTLRDIMTAEVVTVTPETTLRDAADLLAHRHLSGAPVVAREKVVGVLSVSDILDFEASTEPVPTERPEQAEWGEAFEEPPEWTTEDAPQATYFTELWADAGGDTAERLQTIETPEWDLLAEHTVAEAMSRAVRWLPPTMDVVAAADVMGKAQIHRVLVLDRGKLVGIVTTMDITRAVADHQLVVRRYVFDRRGGDEAREGEF